MTDDAGKDRLKRDMASMLDVVETLYATDRIGAIQICIALRDGNVRTMLAYDDGFKILMIAAASIGQRDALDACQVQHDPASWEEPGGSAAKA